MLDSVASTSSKFASRFKRDRGPPPVPEKDVYLSKPSSITPYASSSFSSSSVSFSSSFIQATTSESAVHGHSPSLPHHALVSSRSIKSLRRAIAKIPNVKIPSLPKRPSFAASSSSLTPQQEDSDLDHGDANISLPWNISHDLHVEPREDGLAGLPSSWSSALSKAGFSENEIHAMYARQRRLPSFSSSPTTSPGPLPPKPWNRTAQSLPRSVSPSSGTRPYSIHSSAKSTFTYASSEFPSELGSIRIGRDMSDGSAEHISPLSVSSQHPKQNVHLVIDTSTSGSHSSSVPTVPTTPLHLSYADSPSSLSFSMPPEDHEDGHSDNDSDENSGDSADHVSTVLLSPTTPTARTPALPPRLSLSAEAVEEDDWTQSLLSSLGAGSFDPSEHSQSVGLPHAQTDFSIPSPLSDHRRDTIIAPLGTKPLNIPISNASSTAPAGSHLSSSTIARTTLRTSSSIRSGSNGSSSASSISSRASMGSVHDAAIATTQVVRRVSVSHAIALKGSRSHLQVYSEVSSPLSSTSVSQQVIKVQVTSDFSSPDMSVSILKQDSSNDPARLSPDPLTPIPICTLKNARSDEFFDEISPSPSASTSMESREAGPEHPSDMNAENVCLGGDKDPGSAQVIYPKIRSSSLRLPTQQSPTSDKLQSRGGGGSQGSPSPSPSLPPYLGARSFRDNGNRPPSPLGTRSHDVVSTDPGTPNRSDSLRPTEFEGSPVSPLEKALPPVPPGDVPSSVELCGGNPLLPEKQFLQDTGSNAQRTPRDPDVERLFRPLIPYLSAADPLERFSELTQVAEGQFGPVFAARAIDVGVSPSSSPSAKFGSLVAVKTIRVEDEGSPKVEALAIELEVMSQVRHMHILATAGLFVRGDTLWVEMELMERSLADMLPLVEDGLVITEPEVARFASDILSGLAYLEGLNIAHRDVRSDNLLLSRSGVLKLADFSHAVVTQRNELCTSVIPVPPYWMAPEMRLGRPYNAHLVDVWSVGATIWEIIEGSPPFLDIEDPSDFGDRWPPLQRVHEFSTSLHQFLRLCSEMDDWRPHSDELLDTPFIRGACSRPEIVTLLAEVRLLEDGLGDQ